MLKFLKKLFGKKEKPRLISSEQMNKDIDRLILAEQTEYARRSLAQKERIHREAQERARQRSRRHHDDDFMEGVVAGAVASSIISEPSEACQRHDAEYSGGGGSFGGGGSSDSWGSCDCGGGSCD